MVFFGRKLGQYADQELLKSLFQNKTPDFYLSKSCVSLWCSGAVVQWLSSCLHVQINRVRLPATLFSVSSYLFFLLTLFSFWPFSFFILTAEPTGHALGSIYIY